MADSCGRRAGESRRRVCAHAPRGRINLNFRARLREKKAPGQRKLAGPAEGRGGERLSGDAQRHISGLGRVFSAAVRGKTSNTSLNVSAKPRAARGIEKSENPPREWERGLIQAANLARIWSGNPFCGGKTRTFR